MKSIKNQILQFLTYIPFKKFEYACKNIQLSFEDNWRETKKLLLTDQNFWIKKGYHKKSNLEDFDITSYGFYESTMHEGMSSGVSPFSGEKVKFAAMTSGTNGSMKPFLITKSYQKQYQIVTPPFVHSMSKHVDLGKGKFIYLISLDSTGFLNANVPTGTIGNFTYKNLPKLFRSFYALPSFLLKNPDFFKERSSYYCLASDISALFAVTPPIAINFLNNIAFDIKNKIAKVLDPAFQKELNINLGSKREQFLKQLLNEECITIAKLWPTLQIVSCWTTAICSLSIPELQTLVGPKVQIVDGFYSATEGWVTVQTDLYRKGCAYHPQGCILEFLEEGKEVDKKNLLKPWKLELGKSYEVFFTNKMGLIRYQIGDVVKCNGYYYESPLLEFVGKSSSAISLGIVRLTEREIISAATTMLDKSLINNFFISYSHDGHGLGFYLKQNTNVKNIPIDTIVKAFDEELMKLSKDYKKERQNGTLKNPRIYILQEHIDLFIQDQTGQKKPKVIYNNVDIIKFKKNEIV